MVISLKNKMVFLRENNSNSVYLKLYVKGNGFIIKFLGNFYATFKYCLIVEYSELKGIFSQHITV